MKSIERIKTLFWSAVGFQFLMSATILIMPLVTQTEFQSRKITLFIGLLFWISAIIGYSLVVMANSERKWFAERRLENDAKTRCGVVVFFANVPATIADVTMISTFVLFVITCFTNLKYEYISYIVLFLFVFSFHMHCMFNGRIYKMTKYKPTKKGK